MTIKPQHCITKDVNNTTQYPKKEQGLQIHNEELITILLCTSKLYMSSIRQIIKTTFVDLEEEMCTENI